MSTIQIIMLVLFAAVTIVATVFAQRGYRAIKNAIVNHKSNKEARKARADAADNERKYAEAKEAYSKKKTSKFQSFDETVEGFYENYELEWVRVVGGTKRYSFDELFDKDRMTMETYQELVRFQQTLEELKVEVNPQMYLPQYRREIDTMDYFQRNLVVYLTGRIRVSDRLILDIDKTPEGHMTLIGVTVSLSDLDNASMTHNLNFLRNSALEEEAAKEEVRKSMKIWDWYLAHPKFKDEAVLMSAVNDDFEFYNKVIDDDDIEIIGNRVFTKNIVPLPVPSNLTAKDPEAEAKRIKRSMDQVFDAREQVAQHPIVPAQSNPAI